MRYFLLITACAALFTTAPALAQQQKAKPASSRPSPAAKPAPKVAEEPKAAPAVPSAPARLTCAPLDGRVTDADSRPLIGATVTLKGTSQILATDAEGRFHLPDPLYADQVLLIESPGYTTEELPLVNCSLPIILMKPAPGTRIKQSGKRAGQVIRYRDARL